MNINKEDRQFISKELAGVEGRLQKSLVKEIDKVRKDMANMEGRIKTDMGKFEDGVRSDMIEMENRLNTKVDEVKTDLRIKIDESVEHLALISQREFVAIRKEFA